MAKMRFHSSPEASRKYSGARPSELSISATCEVAPFKTDQHAGSVRKLSSRGLSNVDFLRVFSTSPPLSPLSLGQQLQQPRLIQNRHLQLLRLVELGASFFAGNDVVGLLADGSRYLSARRFDPGFRVLAAEIGQRSRQHQR